jgi:short-subunit dehydrogenase
VLIAYGVLTDQERCNTDTAYMLEQFNLNGTSTISLASLIGRELEQRASGTLAVIGSVAGDRGRQSNYCYGSAKASVESFLSGLRGYLSKSGVNVLTIKPGFVDTPMTRDFKKGLLWASADKVAKDIDSAVQKRRSVLYTPWFWRYIMLVIKSIPEFVFRKLPL